jgi:hypothetical protein
MRESRTYGSVRGARSNARPYRDRFARNDSISAYHCEEYSDEAISVKVRTGGNHLSGLHH